MAGGTKVNTSGKKNIPWYASYERLAEEVDCARERFQERCQQLGHGADAILAAFQRDLVARTVHESNWQEGVELEFGRTQELAEIVMDDLRFPEGGRLDLAAIADVHREQILQLNGQGATMEEIATVNLARAHTMLNWTAQELAFRQTASLAYALRGAEPGIKEFQDKSDADMPPKIVRGLEIVQSLLKSVIPTYGPMQPSIVTSGELLSRLLDGSFESLLNPMDVRYIHALHRVTMMGIISKNQLGCWRHGMVHVGNPDVVFPPREALDALMKEFCSNFPPFLPGVTNYDPIKKAASVSYKFVRIHPYQDGNGRVSRLLMNLVLWGHHPLVSLAPRAKERHRYRQAIRRADRGKSEPLACLVAISVRDTYTRMLDALRGSLGQT